MYHCFKVGFFFSLFASAIFTVSINEERFNPSTVEVNQGETILFKNTGQNPHWPASDIHPTHGIYPELDPKRPLNPEQSWEFKFEKAGEWRMHDHLYPTLRETVIVRGKLGILGQILDYLQSFFLKLRTLIPWFSEPIAISSQEIFNDDAALRSYVKKFGPKQTVGQLSALASTFGSCHDPAHKAGRFAYEIFGDKAFKECSSECHSGCYHGATEAFFREKGTVDLQNNVATLCNSELNLFFSHQCVHGIGHGLMAWTNYEIFEALKDCELLPQRQDSCWTGVFMENIVGGLAGRDGHFTKYLNGDPHYPCSAVPEKYKWACYFLQTSRMVQLFNGDFSRVAQACSAAPKPYQPSCFLSMGRDVGGTHRDEPASAIAQCSFVPVGEMRQACLSGAVQDSFWDPSGQNNALSFCQQLPNAVEKGSCYRTIFNRAIDVFPSKKERELFCGKAESAYKSECKREMLL